MQPTTERALSQVQAFENQYKIFNQRYGSLSAEYKAKIMEKAYHNVSEQMQGAEQGVAKTILYAEFQRLILDGEV